MRVYLLDRATKRDVTPEERNLVWCIPDGISTAGGMCIRGSYLCFYYTLGDLSQVVIDWQRGVASKLRFFILRLVSIYPNTWHDDSLTTLHLCISNVGPAALDKRSGSCIATFIAKTCIK